VKAGVGEIPTHDMDRIATAFGDEMNLLRQMIFLTLVMLPLAGCNDALDSVSNKVEHPLPQKTVNKMKANDMSTRSPIMMRIFKEEGILEVWKQKGNGRYDMIAEYEICKWSGKLGPKFAEGDRQAPEGYYKIYPHQMNPKSSYYLSFNMGYPNSYDRAYGRTGSNLMVHGACSSAGCYSMTDEQVLEIYAFAREAFRGGQPYFTVAAYPFKMTPENMARHRKNEHFKFWEMLKIGYDQFELTKRPPVVEVCEKRYVFNQQVEDTNARFSASATCPAMSTPSSLAMAYQAYEKKWDEAFTSAVAKVDREEAKRLEDEARAAEAAAKREAEAAERKARAEARANDPKPLANLFSLPGSAPTGQPLIDTSAPAQETAGATEVEPAPAESGTLPVPTTNPQNPQSTTAAAAAAEADKKPFWKIWGDK